MAEGSNRQIELLALDLVGKVYEAAAQARLWPDFLDAFAAATHSGGTILWLHDFADSSAQMQPADASFACSVRIGQEHLQSYAGYYTFKNPWLKRIESLPEGSAASSSQILPETQLRKGEFYADWLRPQGYGFALGGPVLKRGSGVAMFSFLRDERAGAYSDEDVRLLGMLIPHMRRACMLHQRLTPLLAQAVPAQAALDLLDDAVWLLDRQGRLLHANRAGRELDASKDGLWIGRDGRPTAAAAHERGALCRAIQAALAPPVACDLDQGNALLVRRPGKGSLQVRVYRLATDPLLQASAVAVFIADPAQARSTPESVLRALYGLTPAEARIAQALASGNTVEEYGTAADIRMSTARTHLKHAMHKCGVRRQSQLVALVRTLPTGRSRR